MGYINEDIENGKGDILEYQRLETKNAEKKMPFLIDLSSKYAFKDKFIYSYVQRITVNYTGMIRQKTTTF